MQKYEEITTEGIKYAGSKLKLLPHILSLAEKVQPRMVFDGFSGTTRVSQAFAQAGYGVTTNDVAVWSKVFGECYLLSLHPREHYAELIDHLNALPGRHGWFTEHYGNSDGLKKPWQQHNTLKLDAIREEIEQLDHDEKAVALTSLILAMDEVDSTIGHYASYLSEWSPRSYREMRLRVPWIISSTNEHVVHQSDIFDIVSTIDADLAYYDPPYGSNNDKMPPSRVRYASYYHLWTSICLFDKPDLFGKANRRVDTSDTLSASVFEDFRRNESGRFLVVEAIERLLQQTKTRHIILSYSSGGRATAEELNDVIRSSGKLLEVVEVDYKRNVMGGMRWTHEWVRDAEEKNREFLFLIERF
ncbi:MAG TPA: DNA adenine methylase [Pyrinomonadaceae bacterium]|jgi:adenine-specific DNA-methyltransferase|nr:DNA adenine methylase [Pyrinomonadaceae bacterium]